MRDKIFFVLLMVIFMITNVSLAASIELTGNVATPDYWTKKNTDGDKIIMDSANIERLNGQMREKDSYASDLSKFPETMSAETVKSKINRLTDDVHLTNVDGLFYTSGEAVPFAAFQKIMSNRNLDSLTGQLKVRYAVTLERTDLKLVPDKNGWFEKPVEYRYDQIQGTAIDPAEAVAVLSENVDGTMLFVQTRNYFGWIEKSKVTFTDRATWLTYINPSEFLVVINNKKFVNVNGKMIMFQMGAKIPLKSGKVDNNNWTARIPVDTGGTLSEVEVKIPNDIHVNKGFLLCTSNNFIRQGFKWFGSVYGWGGLNNSVDCSAFVADVYRTMGIEIPRDADRQSICLPLVKTFGDVTHADRLNSVKTIPVGSLLFKPGHVMMYLGVDDKDTPLVIHSASSYYENGNKVYVRKVLVSDLNYKNASNVATIDSLTGASFIR